MALGASEAVGYGVGRRGFDGDDLTGSSVTVFAGVPEPTTRASVIPRFRAIGGAMRRRPRTTLA